MLKSLVRTKCKLANDSSVCKNVQKRTSLSFQKSYIPWVSVLLPRVTYDLSATPRGRPYDAVTQLREILARMSSLLEVYPAQGMTTWVPTHALQPLATRPGCISAFLSHHARRLPWDVPSPGSCLSQRFSKGGTDCHVPTPHAWVLHESGHSLLVLGIWP